MNTRLEAKAKLEEAIQNYVEVCSGVEGTVRTDYVLNVAAVNMHMPMDPAATFHFRETSGSLHALAGLNWLEQQKLVELNLEEAELDAK